jgi:hypothetical protein
VVAPPAGVRVAPDGRLLYTICFENDPKTATLPIQVVTVTDRLPTTLDWSTFELADSTVGSHTAVPPPGRAVDTEVIDLRGDGVDIEAQLTAQLDPQTGVVVWRFTSLDPTTQRLTTNQLAGFLPPDDASHRGEGSVSFFIRPKPGLAFGMTIANQATIVFDQNAPIATNQTVSSLGGGGYRLPAGWGGECQRRLVGVRHIWSVSQTSDSASRHVRKTVLCAT